MKQGKTLSELGRELQRQRQKRQDFLADTRTLAVESNSYGSTLHMSLDNNTYEALVENGGLSANIRAAMIFRFVRPHHRTSTRNKRLFGRGYSYRVRRRQFICDDRVLLDRIDKHIDQYVSYKQRKNKKRSKRPC